MLLIMKKQKIYLDTSLISHLEQYDAQQLWRDMTRKLWSQIKLDKYIVYISDIVLAEIDETKNEEKRQLLRQHLEEIDYIKLSITEEIEKLATLYIENGIIPIKYFDDAMHIAISTINECDIIVSWNFKHFVQQEVIAGVNGINKIHGYKEVQIHSPLSMIREEG